MTGAAARVVLATRNAHKVLEIRAALALSGVVLETLDDHPDAPEVEEDGDTFLANARKKAHAIAAATGLPALADDSGLVVEALGGKPGVRSARFAGPGSDDAANRAELRRRLEGESDRRAAFRCVLVAALPDGREISVEGECAGTLREEDRGVGGFGYDPLFVPDGSARTFAEMTRAEKAALSHRGRALVKVRGPLADLLGLAGV